MLPEFPDCPVPATFLHLLTKFSSSFLPPARTTVPVNQLRLVED